MVACLRHIPAVHVPLRSILTRGRLTNIDPCSDVNLSNAAALAPRGEHHSILSERSNFGFLVSKSSDFRFNFALAAPIDLHLHMIKLGVGCQEHELGHSARNAGICDSRSLECTFQNMVQGNIRCMRLLTEAGARASHSAKTCTPRCLSFVAPSHPSKPQ